MSEHLIHTTDGELDHLLQSHSLVLVDFWGENCYPCQVVNPVVERLADKYAGRAAVAKVDVNTEEALAARYDIQGIPTVLVFKEGRIIAREVGARPPGVYEDILDANVPKD